MDKCVNVLRDYAAKLLYFGVKIELHLTLLWFSLCLILPGESYVLNVSCNYSGTAWWQQ